MSASEREARWAHFRPTDLAAMLSCEHLVALERRAHLHELSKPYFEDPARELLQLRGEAHERQYLESLNAQVAHVHEIVASAEQRDAAFWARGVAETKRAMERGAEVIYQAPLSAERYSGIADF